MGDSCWSQEFSIVASLCAGKKLGYTLLKAFLDNNLTEQGLSPYFEWYRKYCFEPHGKGIMAGGGISLSEYLSAEEIDYLVSLPDKPAPHTLSFYELFEIIKKYTEDNINTSIEDILENFGTVIAEIGIAKEKDYGAKYKSWNTKEPIKLSNNQEIAVNSRIWTGDRTDKLIIEAKKLGYEIKTV